MDTEININEKLFIQLDNKKRKATVEEIAQIQKDQAEQLERKRLIKAESELKKATLDSAIAKLAKLGLTEDEAKAIVGIQ